MATDVLAIVSQVIRDVLQLPQLNVSRETTAKDVEEWTSMVHVKLIVAIEERFSIRFALSELQALKNVGDMVDLIQQKRQS